MVVTDSCTRSFAYPLSIYQVPIPKNFQVGCGGPRNGFQFPKNLNHFCKECSETIKHASIERMVKAVNCFNKANCANKLASWKVLQKKCPVYLEFFFRKIVVLWLQLRQVLCCNSNTAFLLFKPLLTIPLN